MSNSTEEYLEALYALARDDHPAGTKEISQRLNVAPASVTEMLKKLAESGLVNYAPYQGVTLTDAGFRSAQKMARKHRLLERFLHDVLKINNTRVHAEACRLEHGLSDEADRALCQTLKHPDTCPDDGQAIPPCDFQFATCDECRHCGEDQLPNVGKRGVNVVSLTALKQKENGKISFIRGDRRVLSRLLDMGLTPGTSVNVTRVAPMGGPMQIAVRGSSVALGSDVASNVFVERVGKVNRSGFGSPDPSAEGGAR